jgi:hypothetical protein
METQNIQLISLDQKKTWPLEILHLLEERKDLLNKYLIKEKEIDDKAKTDVLIRYKRPSNPFSSVYFDIKKNINSSLHDKRIIGYHCTRLVPDEMQDILDNGVHVLTQNFILRKLNILYSKSVITKEIFNYLVVNNLSNEQYRKNRAYLFHSQDTLKDQCGLYRLFGLWGGESIFKEHSDNKKILKILNSIGEACIVICSVDSNEIIDSYDVCDRIINYYIYGNFNDFDSDYDHTLKVEKIICESNPCFEYLTEYSKWDCPQFS